MGHILFWILIGVWVVLDFYILIFHNKKATHSRSEKRSKYVMIALIVCGMFAGQYIAPASKLVFTEPFNMIRSLSIPLMFAGLIIRIIAVVQLGKYFSADVSIFAEKQLFKGGLYKYVRHPSYLGELLICAGVAVCFYHPISSALAFLLPLAAFLYRISVEEKMLRQHFGKEYIDYSRSTKKLIPFVI